MSGLSNIISQRVGNDASDERRAIVRRIFMAHGFTIKDGQTDLKPYVYEAAEALLRELSPAVAVPEAWRDVIQQAADKLQDSCAYGLSDQLRAMLAAAPQAAAPDEVAKDAARYRWLRQDESEFSSMAPAELDAAIDKAIAAAQKGGA